MQHCPLAEVHFNAEDFDVDDEPAVFLTEREWCNDDRVTSARGAQVVLQTGSSTEVVRLILTILGDFDVQVGGPWQVVQSATSTTERLVFEMYQSWAPKAYGKSERTRRNLIR